MRFSTPSARRLKRGERFAQPTPQASKAFAEARGEETRDGGEDAIVILAFP